MCCHQIPADELCQRKLVDDVVKLRAVQLCNSAPQLCRSGTDSDLLRIGQAKKRHYVQLGVCF